MQSLVLQQIFYEFISQKSLRSLVMSGPGNKEYTARQ